jgi:small redox-active disulfide protein 2
MAYAKKTLEHVGLILTNRFRGLKGRHNWSRLMEEKDYRLVLVGNTQVGLLGLNGIFEELKAQRGMPESDLKQMLVEMAGKKNYIPQSVKEEYAKALFREFKKSLGEKVEEERGEFLEVIVLGTGCFSCNQLEKDIVAVLSETGIKAGLNHVTDPSLIVQYGILPSPALIINGKVKSAGRVPSKSMIKKWLEEEKG